MYRTSRARGIDRETSMTVELKVPAVGESITEVQIGRLAQGARATRSSKDENLVELETDKATVELPAPVAGMLSQDPQARRARRPTVGEVIGYIGDGAAAADGASGRSRADEAAGGRQGASAAGRSLRRAAAPREAGRSSARCDAAQPARARRQPTRSGGRASKPPRAAPRPGSSSRAPQRRSRAAAIEPREPAAGADRCRAAGAPAAARKKSCR